MKEIERGKYGLRRGTIGWKVKYLAVDICDGQVCAYERKPKKRTKGTSYWAARGGEYRHIEGVWLFGADTIVRVVKSPSTIVSVITSATY